jgi:hypothetical protein
MNRWQRKAQTTWLGGAYQNYWEDDTKYRASLNVDVLTHGEIKLSKKLGSALYSGNSEIKVGIYFNGAHYWAEGQYIKYSSDNFATTHTSADFGVGNIVTDLEIWDGKLWAAVGTAGVHYHGRADHTTWAELEDSGNTISCDFVKGWGDNLFITYTNTLKYYNGSTITLVKDFASGSDNTYFLKKPNVYASKLYIPINADGSSVGKGEIWYYDGTDLDIIFSSYDPVGGNTVVYDGYLIFVVYGLEKMMLKKYDGSKVVNIHSLDVLSGSAIFGTGLKFGSGVVFGAGSDKFEDPINFMVWNENLMFSVKRSASQNNIFIYDTYGFSEYMALPTGPNYVASLWIYDRDLFIGGNDNVIYMLGSEYKDDGWLQSSVYDADLQDINKLYADIMIKHAPMKTGDSIEVWYRTNEDGGFNYLGVGDTLNSVETTLPFPIGSTTVISRSLEYKLVLKSANGSTTPIVKDVIVRYILAPDNSKRVFEYIIEATKQMQLLDGTFETRTPEEIIADLWALKTCNELLVLTDEDNNTYSVVFADTSPEIVTPFAGDEVTEKYVYVRLFEL